MNVLHAPRRARSLTATIIALVLGSAGLGVTLLATSNANAASVTTVRIDSGATQNYTDGQGRVWGADRYYSAGSGGSGVVIPAGTAISGANYPKLYETERWGLAGYAVPLPNDKYTVNLKFAEINPASGTRSFNVSLEGAQVLSAFSPAVAAGGNYKAITKSFTASVADGTLNIGFAAIQNAASISAIEIIGTTAVTSSTTSTTATTKPPTTVPTTLAPPSTATAVRIDSGSTVARTDSAGRVWAADKNFAAGSGGTGVVIPSGTPIAGTADQVLYQTERWGLTGYSIPVTNGTYAVNLRFAEINPASGTRSFDVAIEGNKVLTAFSPAVAAGGNYVAITKSFTANVSDGVLNIGFTAIKNAPAISAIEVIGGAQPNPATTTTTTNAPTSTTRPPTTLAPTTSTTTTSTTTAPPTPTTPMPVGVAGNWKLAFQDEFNGTSLDTSKWIALNNWNMNNVKAYASNVSVSGGALHLALPNSSSGAFVSSAPYDGAGSNGFVLPINGYAESRVFFPGTGSTCYNWPAWWSSGPAWPAAGEHDIAEVLGGSLTVNYHSPSGSHNQGSVSGSWCGSYHVYGVYRMAKSAAVYWDGKLVKTYSTDDNGGGEALLLNVGDGGVHVYGSAATVNVDYVRAWLAQ